MKDSLKLSALGVLPVWHRSKGFFCNAVHIILQRTLVIRTVFVTKDFAVKSNFLL